MKKLFKAAAVAVLAAAAVTAAQAAVMAEDTGLPHAVVTELSGSDLDVELEQKIGNWANLDGGSFTMNKAARFSTSYTNDAAGVAQKQDDLAKYGNWICDYEITVDTSENSDEPGPGVNGDKAILVGEYGTWGNIGFKLSALADTIVDGKYYIMKATGIDDALKYKEVVNNVKAFTCGLVDNGLDPYVKVSVQLVMFESNNDNGHTVRDETKMHKIGDPVIYEKKAAKTEGADPVPVGNLDAEITEKTVTEVPNLTVTGIKDAIKPTEKTKLINDYLVSKPQIITDAQTEELTVNVEIKAKAEEVVQGTRYSIKPYAEISCNGYGTVTKDISDDQLTLTDTIKVVIPSNVEPLYILHYHDDGTIDKYVQNGEPSMEKYTYDNATGICTLMINSFSDLEIVTDENLVEITDFDAYIDNAGEGNIRFITSYKGDEAVTEYGIWIVSPSLLKGADENFTQGVKVSKAASDLGMGQTFHADMMSIPSEHTGETYYAKSFVKTSDKIVWSGSKSMTIGQYKNNTSK